MRKQIGLFGFGCVAQGLYEGLKRNPNLNGEIAKICVKNADKERDAPKSLFTTDVNDILDDSNIDIVIELIDDDAVALDIVRKSLEKKVPVISANKKMVAENLAELVDLQVAHQTPVLYEGAVAGSIPILQNLDQFFGHQEIGSVRGILNGSTNYILTKMKNESVSFESALKEAQELGFAETDPSLDVKGIDATYKTIILAFHAFGSIVDVSQVSTQGIDKIPIDQLLQSRMSGSKLKLVANIANGDNGLELSVAPEVVNEQDSLYAIDNEFNAIEVDGSLSGKQTYVGKGAGSLPTGSAVLNDLYLLLSGFSYKYLTQKTLRKSA